MAFSGNGATATLDTAPFSINATPDKYAAIGELLNAAASSSDAHGKPDVSELLVQTYGDQGITGFLKMTGAVTSAGASDQIEFYEVGRRHQVYDVTASGVDIASEKVTIDLATLKDATGTAVTSGDLEPGDVFMNEATGIRLFLHSTDSTHFIFARLDGAAATTNAEVSESTDSKLIHLGNMYSQGSDQPSRFTQPDVDRRIQTYAIVKDRFQVNGSQATNVGYINIGNGDYRWFMYGEQEARKRFEDRREMILLFGEQNTGTNALAAATDGSNGNFAGTEGYITALETGGNVWASNDGVNDMADIDTILAELDANGAPSEYAMYLNRDQSLKFDDMVATKGDFGNGAGFGAFDNNADMALQLGFKSFSRGGYTFHKHDWKLLNDPTLLGAGTADFYKGVMCPLTTVADARTGISAPALEMKYKASNGYSREMEHWVTGGGIMGHTNGDNGQDVMTFHYRSEVALVTRARNQHVLIRKA